MNISPPASLLLRKTHQWDSGEATKIEAKIENPAGPGEVRLCRPCRLRYPDRSDADHRRRALTKRSRVLCRRSRREAAIRIIARPANEIREKGARALITFAVVASNIHWHWTPNPTSRRSQSSGTGKAAAALDRTIEVERLTCGDDKASIIKLANGMLRL
jgi:hypothetical protein